MSEYFPCEQLEKPLKVVPTFHEKVWGTTNLQPWFENPEQKKIGEVWFTSNQNLVECGPAIGELLQKYPQEFLGTKVKSLPGNRFPILVKFIFTSEKLSVQVHPDDEYGLAHENSPGKTEMWYVLRAEEGACLGLGLRRVVSVEELRRAAQTGEIEELIQWFPVKPGETYFTPAGTIHAIGPNLVVCEIQENSDITYRLYDYGRPRELHLEKALQVARREPHPGKSQPEPIGPNAWLLAQCPYFATELHYVDKQFEEGVNQERFRLLIILEGEGTINGQAFRAGEVWIVPAAAKGFKLETKSGVRLLRTYVP